MAVTQDFFRPEKNDVIPFHTAAKILHSIFADDPGGASLPFFIID